MNECESLLRKMSAQQLAAFDTSLFLDTHPDCTEALEAQRKYSANAQELQKQYTESCGMLMHGSSMKSDRWGWIYDPWPWD